MTLAAHTTLDFPLKRKKAFPGIYLSPRHLSESRQTDMCKVHFQQQPICKCIGISEIVQLCPLFALLPENRNKTTFKPKVLTRNCQGLDLCFNGIDYVSIDVKNRESDVVPKGLDCPDVELCDEGEDSWPCDLCDCRGALKFIKAKGIEYTFDKAVRALEMEPQDKVVEEIVEEKMSSESVERYKGESGDRPESISSRVGGVGNKVSLAQKMMEKRERRTAGQRARSGLAESISASME